MFVITVTGRLELESALLDLEVSGQVVNRRIMSSPAERFSLGEDRGSSAEESKRRRVHQST
ncbi:MAG TPA: hypothetical protein VFV02_13060 [Acidimicrobiales bacterium]|nr:hypothetical protein [Acidimicrobiales bacterium]